MKVLLVCVCSWFICLGVCSGLLILWMMVEMMLTVRRAEQEGDRK